MARLDRIERLAVLRRYKCSISGTVYYHQIAEEVEELFAHLPDVLLPARLFMMDHATQIIEHRPEEVVSRLWPMFARALSVPQDARELAAIDWDILYTPLERPALQVVK